MSDLFQEPTGSATDGDDSLFGGVNFDEGTDNPWGLDPGTHHVSISEVEKTTSRNDNLGLWLTFSNEDGQSIRKWITLPTEDMDPADRKRNTSYLRVVLNSLEIPQDRWTKLAREDFIGLDCVIVVARQKENPEYTQIKKISRDKGGRANAGSDNMDDFTATRYSDEEIKAGGGMPF